MLSAAAYRRFDAEFAPLERARNAFAYAAAVAVAALPAPAGSESDASPAAGERGGRGLALFAAKALCCELDGRQVVDHAVVLVRDGRIEAVGGRDELDVPAEYERRELGARWLMPGMIDLHSHVGGDGGINDMVLQVNPGLRVAPTFIADNADLRRALSAGITTVLYIPGSGTTMGGQGMLVKTGPGSYDELCLRTPGSLKIAQGDNPTRWGYGMGRIGMNFHIRDTLRKGLAYAKAWERFDAGEGPEPERKLHLDVFRDLRAKRTQISTHTQYYRLVLSTLDMLRREFGFDVYIDHGSFDSWELGALAEELGVAAILGPREVMWPNPPRFDTDGRCEGSAWGFQLQGHTRIGFNTDAPVVPEEELPLQSAMGVRYGMDNARLDAVRGLTIVPAVVAGIHERVGSLEPEKDADLLVVTGDPSDPRESIEAVFIEGRVVYDAASGVRRW